HAMGVRRQPVGRRYLEQLHFAGLGVDLADRGTLVRDVAGEPELAVEIEPGIMYAPTRDEDGRRAERPVAAVVLHEVRRQAHVRIERNVVFLEHHPRGLAGGARLELDLHRAFAWAACTGEIGRQLLLMVVENAGGLAL